MRSDIHYLFEFKEKGQFLAAYKEMRVFCNVFRISEEIQERLNIILKEIGSNINKYADNGGYILLRKIGDEKSEGIEIIGIDNGPGMENIDQKLQDGISTSTSLGYGLGSIKRMSDYFDIYSYEGKGTVVLSKIYFTDVEKEKPEDPDLDYGFVQIAKKGFRQCGDGWSHKKRKGENQIMVCDGLGHGREAQVATQTALGIFKRKQDLSLCDLLLEISNNSRSTRGLVASLISINIAEKKIRHCGIGNINVRLFRPGISTSFVMKNGIIGYNIPKRLVEEEKDWNPYSLLIMHSDGVSTRWRVENYPGLDQRSSTIIAAVLYRDFARKSDDAIILAVKQK